MRVLVCGGRDYTDMQAVYDYLDKFCTENGLWSSDEYLPTNLTIIHGGAKGADLLADYWAVTNWVPVEEYKPDWEKYGKSAGFIRNTQMLKEGKPDVVIAFPGGKGTAMMIKIAKKAGVKVLTTEEHD